MAPPTSAPLAPPDQPAPADTPLRRPVSTGQDNIVRVSPFEVFNVQSPPKWDPTTQTLAVSYDINDPNARALSGRIVYQATPASAAGKEFGGGKPIVLHITRLTPDLRKHGHHVLPASARWDGKLTHGPADRIGEKVTADLAPIQILVQLWSTAAPAPTPPSDEDDAGADTQREYVSQDWTLVTVDAVIEARWDRSWVVPWDDPDEPQHGAAKMLIRVRNVREGTPVRLQVLRIFEPDGPPENDQQYALTGGTTTEQPGLEGATVRKGQVLLKDGTPPQVRFNDYTQHWIEDGNNFYCFRVALGELGGFQTASQRNYEKHERDCLHLRFTVFIHCPFGDLGYANRSVRELHRFLRDDTKYYHPYLMEGPAKNAADWIRHWRHRYIVVFTGHSACFCDHPDHPHKKKDPDEFMEILHRGFPPDGNVCPTELESGVSAAIQEDMKKYNQEGFDGCGHKSNVTQWSGLGVISRNEKVVLYNTIATPDPTLVYSLQKRAPLDPKDRTRARPWLQTEFTSLEPEDAPRLLFYNGGCRTMLTTNFGECLTAAGTRYHCGWVYSVLDEVDGRFLPEFFKRWIKGTRADPASVEFDIARIPEAYRQLAQRGGATDWHARIMDSSGVLNPAPDKTEAVLR